MTTPRLLAILTYISILPASAFDLNEAWTAARYHSAEYDAARHARAAAQEPQEQAKARLLPQISANANYTNRAQDSYDKYRSHGWNAQISQPLIDGPRWRQYQAEQITARLGDSQLDNTASELMLETGKAYLDILTAQDKLAAVTAEKSAYTAQIAQAKGLFESGEATIIDTYEAQAGLDSANAKEIRLRTELVTAQNRLANLTGLAPDHAEALADKTLPDLANRQSENQWIDQAIANSAAVQTRRLQVEKSEADRATAQSEHWPQLSLNVGYQDNRNKIAQHGGNPNSNRNRGAYVGVQFTIPIYSGGEIRSKEKQSQEILAQRQAELEAETEQIRLQVRQTLATLHGERAQIAAQQQLLHTNTAKLESTRLGREVGVRNTIDEIKAEQEKAQAEEQLAEAKYRYVAACLQLLHLSGELTQDSGHAWAAQLFTPTAAKPVEKPKPKPPAVKQKKDDRREARYSAAQLPSEIPPSPAKRSQRGRFR